MVTQNELARYYKAIGKALNCPRSARNSILKNVKSDVDEYLADNPNASISELQSHFGTPDAYAGEYAASLDIQELPKKISESKFKKKIWLLVAGISVVVISVSALIITKQNQKEAYTYYNQVQAPIEIDTHFPGDKELAYAFVEEELDGSSFEIEIYEDPISTDAASYYKTGYKIHTARNAKGDVIWRVMLKATFLITRGAPTKCVGTSFDYEIINPDWSFMKGDSSGNDNKASASVLFKRSLFFAPDEHASCFIDLYCNNQGNFW